MVPALLLDESELDKISFSSKIYAMGAFAFGWHFPFGVI